MKATKTHGEPTHRSPPIRPLWIFLPSANFAKTPPIEFGSLFFLHEILTCTHGRDYSMSWHQETVLSPGCELRKPKHQWRLAHGGQWKQRKGNLCQPVSSLPPGVYTWAWAFLSPTVRCMGPRHLYSARRATTFLPAVFGTFGAPTLSCPVLRNGLDKSVQGFAVLAHTVGDGGEQAAQIGSSHTEKFIQRETVKNIVDNLKWNTC